MKGEACRAIARENCGAAHIGRRGPGHRAAVQSCMVELRGILWASAARCAMSGGVVRYGVVCDRIGFAPAILSQPLNDARLPPAACSTREDGLRSSERTSAVYGEAGRGLVHAARSSQAGKSTPFDCATRRKWARREAGMPFLRQLWTVDTGASTSRATALVPPRVSITISANVFM